MAYGDVTAAVDIEGVPCGIHQKMLRVQIFAAFGNDGKMPPNRDGKILQNHILTTDQGDALIAEPFSPVPSRPAGRGLCRVAALEYIFQNAVFVKASAGEKALSVYHDVFQVNAVYQAVGEVSMPVILDSHAGIYFRLFIIAAFPLLLLVGMADIGPGCGQDGPLLQEEVHV